jgi:formate-dependent nitrite reductase membrane component NrfD
MYTIVFVSIWFVVVAIAYGLTLALRRANKRVNVVVSVLSIAALVWAAASVFIANNFHGPKPAAGWSSFEQATRDWFVMPGGFLAMLMPLLMVCLFVSALGLVQRPSGSWVPWVASGLALVLTPVGVMVGIYTGCTLAGACF